MVAGSWFASPTWTVPDRFATTTIGSYEQALGDKSRIRGTSCPMGELTETGPDVLNFRGHSPWRPSWVLTMVIFALLAAGCGASGTAASDATETEPPVDDGTEASEKAHESPSPASHNQPPTELTVALPVIDFGFLPLTFAKHQGYYEDEGLDVELVAMQSNASIPAVASKEIDFASAGSGVRAAMQGAPLKAVFYSYQEPTMISVGAADIKDYADLEGKTIAVTGVGASDDFIVRALLEREGISVHDVDILPVGYQGMSAMQSGQVDFSVLNPDAAALLETEGFNILGDTRELWPVPWSGFAVHEDMITDRPEVLQGWLRANVRALLHIAEHPDDAVAFAVEEFDMDPAVARDAVDYILPFVNTEDPGGWTEDSMVRSIEANMAQAELTGDPMEYAEDTHDIAPLRAAQKELSTSCTGGWRCEQ